MFNFADRLSDLQLDPGPPFLSINHGSSVQISIVAGSRDASSNSPVTGSISIASPSNALITASSGIKTTAAIKSFLVMLVSASPQTAPSPGDGAGYRSWLSEGCRLRGKPFCNRSCIDSWDDEAHSCCSPKIPHPPGSSLL